MSVRDARTWLQPFAVVSDNLPLNGLTLDSRQAAAGMAFLAVPGHQRDGREFIPQALAGGAALILAEVDDAQQHGRQLPGDHSQPVLGFYRLGERLSALAGAFYQYPAEQLKLVGVTGTNGKSTVTQLIANWLTLLGQPAAVMGTLGNGPFGVLDSAVNTTGSAVEIQSWLRRFADQQIGHVAMEISSHGLVQRRVAEVPFEVALFTNLSRDHLDYHGTMEAYADAKRLLLADERVRQRIINADDPVGRRWLAEFPEAIAFGRQPLSATSDGRRYLRAEAERFSSEGVTFSVKSSWGDGRLSSPLLGAFNVSNLLAALASLLAMGFELAELLATAPRLAPVCGRMERFSAPGKATIVVDYAHTPDALAQALQTLRPHCRGRLWCLFGCGGERDRGKRPLMAEVAARLADRLVVTDDNPRHEDPRAIAAEILEGCRGSETRVCHDREQAIAAALAEAGPDDLILVAGKGHEDYQIIGDRRRDYSDRATVARLLGGETK